MTSVLRQRKLFAAEDFRVVYRAFTEINFSAYDFDTIRSVMVDYIRQNFPEDFNDWIESSEFVALIDLLAYLGQSLAFRMDLNTRENFIDTAERKESVLRLARLISYIPSRNRTSSGLVKLTQISTTQPIIDSNGTNLQNITISWNDANNPDWFEQFILILNSMFSNTNPFGKPIKSGLVNSITTELFELNNDPVANRVFPFNATINGEQLAFEIVNPDFTDGETFFEREPDPEDPLHMIYRTDGLGNSSPNTGFFLFFKQGELKKEDFSIDVPIENRVLNITGLNINDTDVFVHEIDSDGFIINKWVSVPSVIGNNIIFNSLENNQRQIYSVITRENDQIAIRFADGRFGDVPTGLFRVWSRKSNATRYTIKPEDMKGNRFDVPYLNGSDNTVFFSSLSFDLQQSVSNSSPTETINQIKQRATQVFYTQNRMVNGEDYNVFPLKNQEAAKIKAVNRIHSGFSRHVDINDPTGVSQDINLFAEDGILYFEDNNRLEQLALPTTLTNQELIDLHILSLLQELNKRNFFYFHYPRLIPTVLPISAIAGITGTIGATYVQSQTIVINTVTVTLDEGTTVANAVTDITAAAITGITATSVSGALQISENTGANLVLAEGSGTALFDLGFVAGTFLPRTYGTYWRKATNAINSSTGRLFTDTDTIGSTAEAAIKLGSAATGNELFIDEGAILKFRDAGFVSVVSINGDGDTVLSNGDGAVRLAEDVLDEDPVLEIIMPFRTIITSLENTQVLAQLDQKNSFGLRYDKDDLLWKIITGDNLDTTSDFSFAFEGDVTGTNKDSSWLFRAEFSTTSWSFITRGLDYIFESDTEIRFYNSDNEKIVDSQTGKTIIDFIKLLKVNTVYSTNVTLTGDPSATYASGEDIVINGTTVTFSTGTDVDSAVIDITGEAITGITATASATDELLLTSASSITLAEGSGTALADLGFTAGIFTDFQEATPVVGLTIPITWNVNAVFKESDGFIDPRKLKMSFPDDDEDGIPDDPTIFETFTKITGINVDDVLPNNLVDETELFWEAFTNTDGFQEFKPSTKIKLSVNTTVPTFTQATVTHELVDGDIVFERDALKFHQVVDTTSTLDDVTASYFMRRGRKTLFFQWKHFAPIVNRIDPAITNIIDMYVLTATYDNDIRLWIDDDDASITQPIPPTADNLRTLFSEEAASKMLSDEIIWHPVRYKLLFGTQALEEVQARFKVTKVIGTTVTNGQIKSRVIGAINEFFAINNWDFGEVFYFTELAAFIHQKLATVIGSVVIVPLDDETKFGELFQVRSEPDEVFISTAKVSDVQIVAAFTDEILRIGS